MFLVIAFGNPLRRDDGVGWHLAEQLCHAETRRDGLTVITSHQLTPELAEPLAAADCAVFVDASVEGEPGEVQCRPVYPTSNAAGFSAHRFAPSDLLAAALTLYGASPESHLITVTGQDFGYGTGLSEPVLRATSQVLSQIDALLAATSE